MPGKSQGHHDQAHGHRECLSWQMKDKRRKGNSRTYRPSSLLLVAVSPSKAACKKKLCLLNNLCPVASELRQKLSWWSFLELSQSLPSFFSLAVGKAEFGNPSTDLDDIWTKELRLGKRMEKILLKGFLLNKKGMLMWKKEKKIKEYPFRKTP